MQDDEQLAVAHQAEFATRELFDGGWILAKATRLFGERHVLLRQLLVRLALLLVAAPELHVRQHAPLAEDAVAEHQPQNHDERQAHRTAARRRRTILDRGTPRSGTGLTQGFWCRHYEP